MTGLSSRLINTSFPITSNRSNVGISYSKTGMPPKFSGASNNTSFIIGRKIFFDHNKNNHNYNNDNNLSNNPDNYSKNSYNYLATNTSTTLTNGKTKNGITGVSNTDSSGYIARKKNLAIGKGSTSINNPNPVISFKSSNAGNLNSINQAKKLCRSSGCVPSKKVQNRQYNSGKCC